MTIREETGKAPPAANKEAGPGTPDPTVGRPASGRWAAGPGAPDAPVRLRPPQNGVERRAIVWWALRGLTLWGGALAALAAVAVFWAPSRPWLAAPIVALAVTTVAKSLVEPWWRFAVHRWEITDQATYAVTGWVVREWRVAPTSRVQTVDAVRGPLEQLLGLSTLRVTTASSSGAISVAGLDKDVARDAAERLAAVAEITPGDAT
ncbi:PH domain-containing protein [Actinocorallia sp. API 0066]|uniref:PH domain-containing protein n=1 Tax=Actinocorallia sp. API 0066 TaxID=2896846 RepID=UPI001E4FC322|nr:PH domain-containing protein [Actinocorallia sp. API 0066]MCD0449179.1 PH domain-containing protein [Actinocorallia sp. API 0066]